jgi:hypothetical protein
MNFCHHSWSFPRRWPKFGEQRNVDVQTCSKCGARRVSPIQFGPVERDGRLDCDAAEPAEVRS